LTGANDEYFLSPELRQIFVRGRMRNQSLGKTFEDFGNVCKELNACRHDNAPGNQILLLLQDEPVAGGFPLDTPYGPAIH
jgi:hypothetical protein